jgi:hypothetical protein
MLTELRHLLREAMATNDEKSSSAKTHAAQRETLLRIEKMLMMLNEREF